MSVALHSSLELECTAIGTPPPRISWLKDGHRLERDGVLHRQGELLRIHRVQVRAFRKEVVGGQCHSVICTDRSDLPLVSPQVEDAGLYTCLASSEAGEDGRNHWVQIQGNSQPLSWKLAHV